MPVSPRLALAVLLLAAYAYAADDPGTLTVTIQNLGPAVSPTEIPPPAPPPGEDPALVLDRIINIGQKIWTIIEKNKPVVDVKTSYATALPEGTRTWSQLSGWKPPKGTIYAFKAVNGFGQTVVNVRYQVLRTYGGSYQGKGKYLTAVTIEPLKVEVAWGYKFSLLAEIPESGTFNAGTSDDPLAGMIATVRWQIDTTVKHSSGKSVYYLQGDGEFREVGGPFERSYTKKVEKSLEKALESLPKG